MFDAAEKENFGSEQSINHVTFLKTYRNNAVPYSNSSHEQLKRNHSSEAFSKKESKDHQSELS